MIDQRLIDWLENRPNLEKESPDQLSRRATRPSLDRITTLCKYLGDPQATLDAIHVTGTNGKTSTTRIIESLMFTKGFTTGLITSPHLTQINERIGLNTEPISDFDLENALTTVKTLSTTKTEIKPKPSKEKKYLPNLCPTHPEYNAKTAPRMAPSVPSATT